MPTTPKAAAPRTTGTKSYRYMGDHATELVVGDTRPWVGDGDFIELSPEDEADPKAARLIETGRLVDVSTIVPDTTVAVEETSEGGS